MLMLMIMLRSAACVGLPCGWVSSLGCGWRCRGGVVGVADDVVIHVHNGVEQTMAAVMARSAEVRMRDLF